MLQTKKELLVNAVKRRGFNGLKNLAFRYVEEKREPIKANYLPTALQVEITTACNLKCTMCEHTYMQEIGKNINLQEFKKIVDENQSIQVLNITGIGESFLNKDFVPMIEYARSKGIYVWFSDNFTLLNEEKIEKLLSIGIGFISVSLDGARKETFEKIRIGAKFETVVGNAKKLVKARNEKRLSKPKIGINFVLMKDNYKEIEEMVKLCKEIGADRLMYVTIIDSDNTGNLSLYNLKPEEVKPFLEKAKQTAERLEVKVLSWPEIEFKKIEKTGCGYPWANPYIGYNGDVLPCCYIPQMANARTRDENIMGNIFKQSLKDIWNGEKYQEFRRKIKSKEPPVSCRTCPKFYGQ